MNGKSYILAVSKPWALKAFMAVRPALPGNWSIVSTSNDLDAAIAGQRPRYIFFPHWSARVPETLTSEFECVCFHMTDLPFGRGGSPLQNLIAHGYDKTMLTALRMTQEVDAGPIYAKRPLSLDGSAAEVFERAAPIVCELIAAIVEQEPEPEPQTGAPSAFKRRTPDQSRVPTDIGPHQLYDHIRMLDAPGYPKAFLEHGDWRLEFDRAKFDTEEVEARVRFRRSGEGQ
jgi:methionyl-tRNA formyltransferase